MDKCNIGTLLDKDCHGKKYKYQKQDLILIETLCEEDRLQLELCIATECNVNTALKTICISHRYKFIDAYSGSYKICSDIFQCHKKPVRNVSLRAITLKWYQKVKSFHKNLNIVPGRKLCSNCRKKVGKSLEGKQVYHLIVRPVEMNWKIFKKNLKQMKY